MFFETLDGVKLYYIDIKPEEIKSNVAIIFVPGWAYSCRVFEKQLEYFGKIYRTITFDPRGHGNSEAKEGTITFEQMAKDLEALMDYLSVEKAVLVGWSYGAYATWGIIREGVKDRVLGLVQIDQPPMCMGKKEPNENGKSSWIEYEVEEYDRIMHILSVKENYRNGVENFTRKSAFYENVSDEEIMKICNMADMEHELALMEMASGMTCDFSKEAGEVKTLMFVREQWADTAIPYMQNNYPDTSVCILGGHMMFYEFADKFNVVVKDFVEKLGA